MINRWCPRWNYYPHKQGMEWPSWIFFLTHWGRVTHICVSNLTIIGSDNGLLPDRPQAIIWTNAGLLLIGPLGTNFSEILIEILTFSFKTRGLSAYIARWLLASWQILSSINQSTIMVIIKIKVIMKIINNDHHKQRQIIFSYYQSWSQSAIINQSSSIITMHQST